MIVYQVQGYISGVTNPMFQQRDTWWDLACILDLSSGTGTVQTAEEKRAEDSPGSRPKSTKHHHTNSNSSSNPSSSSSTSATPASPMTSSAESSLQARMDHKFITSVISGIKADLDEHWVKQQFYDYTMSIVQQAQDNESLLSSDLLQRSVKSIFRTNSSRVCALSASKEFQQIAEHPWTFTEKEQRRGVVMVNSPIVQQRVMIPMNE